VRSAVIGATESDLDAGSGQIVELLEYRSGSGDPGAVGPDTVGSCHLSLQVAPDGVGAVVRGPHHDRVLSQPELVEDVQDPAGEVVNLDQNVGPVPVLGLTHALRIGDRRIVHLRVRQVHVEGPPFIGAPGHEVDRRLGDPPVEPGPELRIVGGDYLMLLALFPRIDRLRLQRDLLGPGIRPGGHRGIREVRLHRPQDLVGGPGAPQRLVEPEVDRAALLGVATEVPLAPHSGRIARIGQRLSDCHFPARHPVLAGHGDRAGTGTDGMPAGQKRGAARRALRLDVKVQQPQTIGGELVDPGRRSAAEYAAAVAAELAPSEIVPVKNTMFGFPCPAMR
jgi:hypothetical protein